MDRLHSMRVFSRVVDEGSFTRVLSEVVNERVIEQAHTVGRAVVHERPDDLDLVTSGNGSSKAKTRKIVRA